MHKHPFPNEIRREKEAAVKHTLLPTSVVMHTAWLRTGAFFEFSCPIPHPPDQPPYQQVDGGLGRGGESFARTPLSLFEERCRPEGAVGGGLTAS